MSRLFLAAAGMVMAGAILAPPAGAVGLGPLRKENITDGPRVAFYLTLYNPYQQNVAFRVYAVGENDELTQPQVSIMPADAILGAGRSRQLIVIANELEVGKPYNFRVCAERDEPPQGISINARVCSKLTAQRLR